jgi:hypothetical protein
MAKEGSFRYEEAKITNKMLVPTEARRPTLGCRHTGSAWVCQMLMSVFCGLWIADNRFVLIPMCASKMHGSMCMPVMMQAGLLTISVCPNPYVCL